MRIFVAVNSVTEIGQRQTTALLIAALVRRGGEVWLVNVEDFSATSKSADPSALKIQFNVNGRQVPANRDCTSSMIEAFAQSSSQAVQRYIEPNDLILIRINPGRDTTRSNVHESFLEICRGAMANGVRVFNDPTHLRYFASKACLAAINPRYSPALMVSNRLEQIVEFVRQAPGDCVVKPLVGSRGRNVIRVSRQTPELQSLIETTFDGSGVIAQHFVNANYAGDKRIVTLGGKVLEIDGHLAGIERHPAPGDFRANLHAGGTAHQVTLDDSARETVEYAATLLNDHGIWLAGVDLIGDQIIEFNVFSTGGLAAAEEFSGVKFSDVIVEKLLGECLDQV